MCLGGNVTSPTRGGYEEHLRGGTNLYRLHDSRGLYPRTAGRSPREVRIKF